MTPADLTLVVDNSQAIRDEASGWPAQARSLRIIDDATCVRASEMLKGIKALRQQIAETFDPHIKRAYEAHRALCKEKLDAEAPLTEAERVLKGALVAYEDAQEQIRRARERELQAQAEREDEDRRVSEAAALELDAALTDDPSLLYEAEALLDRPSAVAVSVPKQTPKVAGISYRDNWKAHPEVDIKALAAAVASGALPATYLLANLPALNQIAKATKGTQVVPGVRFINERTVAAGAR